MAIVLSLCAAYVAYCLATNPAGPITTPDSARYLDAWANYPLGYPLFLKVFGARGAIVAQPVIFGAALAFLGREIVRLTKQPWLAAAIIAGCAALPQIREFHASILTESLFLSLVVVILGMTLRFVCYPTWHLLVAVGVTAGMSATVRRTGFAFLSLMLLMVLLERHRLKRSRPALFLAAGVAPFFVVYGIEQAAAPIVHQGHASSLSGRHMFAKAALIDAPTYAEATVGKPALDVVPPGRPAADADRLRTELHRHLENDYAPIRDFLRAAPPDLRAVLTIYYETCLQGGCVDRSRALMPGADEASQTRVLGSVAMDRIARAPMAFLDLVARNYFSLWTVDRLHHPDRAARLSAFIASHRPMPFERMAFSLEPDQTLEFAAQPSVRYMQWAVAAVAVWTAVLAALGCVALFMPARFAPLARFAMLSAMAAHGGLLLTALLAAGFSRFTVGLWPAIVTATLAGVWAVAADTRRPKADATAR